MDIYRHFEERIADALKSMQGEGVLPADMDCAGHECAAPRDAAHGDIASNAAMVLAKRAKMPPRELAQHIKNRLENTDNIEKIEIAGPGFINLHISPVFWQDRIGDILTAGDKWGRSDFGKGVKVNVEFVSANPTGPLHAAHARGAILGDALANLLEATGHEVIREYYINDAGAQVDALARSAYLRYREACGEAIGAIGDGMYPGEYLIEVGEAFKAQHGDSYLGKDESQWLPAIRDFAIAAMMEDIKTDLATLGITMNHFASERALVESGAVDKVMQKLADDDLLYRGMLEKPKGGGDADDWEPHELTLFRATQFGDDVDRPVKKSNGDWTYFATDMAYHMEKLTRDGGAHKLINIWGADHGGYVSRMKAAVAALSGKTDALDVHLCQLVKLTDGGKPVKMSKRAGTFITLADVLENVGKDILRFIMLTRRSDQPLDFDYAKVKEQSRENPVWYVQYAHARAQSVLRQDEAAEAAANLAEADCSLLTDEAEIGLIKLLAAWPRLVEGAAKSAEPHRIAFGLMEIAAAFHALWNKGRDEAGLRFIIAGNTERTRARLALVAATAQVIRSGLAIIGVKAMEKM